MTEAPRRPRRRASRAAIRFRAWVTGGLAFLAPFAALAGSPQAGSVAQADGRDSAAIVVRRITRLVVVTDRPAEAPVRYVYAPAPSSASPGTSSASTSTPVTTTGGS
jgi:hypothetical protein